MVKQGDTITNARTGQVMTFLETGAETAGKLLRIDCISPPTTMREPEHIHPFQENKFEIISGTCAFRIDGKESIAGAGEIVTIPPKVRHFFWNSGDTDAHYIQDFKPALNIDSFFDTFFALSRDGKLNEKGIPNFFHASLIMLKHKNDIRVINPPWAIQLLTYLTLAPVGWLMGYRSNYISIL
ncbi:MAG TPA: cupin domain-containing protein [Chitinophagaceae bacterium]|nr:cupin domain-containing protein [Chitinophagaceae bacterium]